MLLLAILLSSTGFRAFAENDDQSETPRVTDYWFEDFESGGPDDWAFCYGGTNTTYYPGLNSARCFYTATLFVGQEGNDEGVGFTTHHVRMGEAPEFSFWYKLSDLDFFSDSTPTSAERGWLQVLVTDDDGQTWTKVHEIGGPAEIRHIPSKTYQKIKLDLPQYAGKTCQVKLLFNDGIDDMMSYTEITVDDVAIGTPPQADLGCDFLRIDHHAKIGEQQIYRVNITNYAQSDSPTSVVSIISTETGETIASVTTSGIPAGETRTVEASAKVKKAGLDTVKAVVITQGDDNQDNDTSNNLIVTFDPDSSTQVSFEDGEALASASYPINFSAIETATQSIYPANKLGYNRATIHSIVYSSYMKNVFKGEPFQIYIGETDIEDFTQGKFIDETDFTLVFDGPMVFSETDFADVVIPFIEPYEYNGGNLVVMCRKIGEEFMFNRAFIIHKTDRPLSILSITANKGLLQNEKGEYVNPTPNAILPETRFNVTPAPYGQLYGTVTADSAPLEGVKVMIDGTSIYTFTDASGKYSFPTVAEGQYRLTFDHFGYNPAASDLFEIIANETTTVDVQLTNLPLYTFTGTVRDINTQIPVSGVTVTMCGYENYRTVTDKDGKFNITDVFGGTTTGLYTLRLTSPYYEATAMAIEMTGDSDKDITVEPMLLEPSSAVAEKTPDGIKINWTAPVGQIRHDTGEPVDGIGYESGWKEIIIGSVFPGTNTIHDIRFFVGQNPKHNDFNVFIFSLDENGVPDCSKKIYEAAHIPFVEDDWTIWTLEEPLTTNGCFVAVSCQGFLNLAVTLPSEDYPFETGMHYYAGESYNFGIYDMNRYQRCHPMIRIGVEVDESTSAPTPEYSIYRVSSGQDSVMLGHTHDNWYTDSDWDSMPATFRYAIKANYGEKSSKETLTNEIAVSSVESIDISVNDFDGAVWYSLDGTIASPNTPGIKIVHLKDGRVIKVAN